MTPSIRRQDLGARDAARRSSQRGVVLFISLIALVALSLAGIAFMRAVGTGGLIAGNLAFARAAVGYSDAGMEQARNDVLALAALTSCGGPCIDIDQPTPAGLSQRVFYRSNWQAAWNYRTANWDNSDSGVVAAPPAGYQIRYVVHRLCLNNGPVAGNQCVTDPQTPVIGGGLNLGSLDYGSNLNQGTASVANPPPYYRITIRVQGPRNTVVYTQAWMA